MTRETFNPQALRAAAEKATPGEWCLVKTSLYDWVILPMGLCEHERFHIIAAPYRNEDLDFIALANPQTILALLERLAAADRIIHLAIRVHLGEDHMGIYVDNLVHDLTAYDRARAEAQQGDAT